MPGFGDARREIKTIADLRYLLKELTEVHEMPDDCEITFVTPAFCYPDDVKVFASGDISYSSNSAVIDVETD